MMCGSRQSLDQGADSGNEDEARRRPGRTRPRATQNCQTNDSPAETANPQSNCLNSELILFLCVILSVLCVLWFTVEQLLTTEAPRSQRMHRDPFDLLERVTAPATSRHDPFDLCASSVFSVAL